MSFVNVDPEALIGASSRFGVIGASMNAQIAAAEGPANAVVPPAADEVSAFIAAQFAMHGRTFRSVCAQAAAVHEMFVKTLAANAGSYAETEATNAAATAE
jgi:hypothetical protein